MFVLIHMQKLFLVIGNEWEHNYEAQLWSVGMEPYYPVNNEQNNQLFEKYRVLAEKEENVIFGGRLGNYQYYDMDKVIEAALETCEWELGTKESMLLYQKGM